jgi:RNA polymerase sigma factor (sigma-70 family)
MADGGGPEPGPVIGGEPAEGSARVDPRSDAELLAVLRGRPADEASSLAFAALYDRHRDAARGLARQLARSPADADDLVSSAFARLLEILRAGGGPTEAFRAYLLTSLRHLAYDRTRAERRLDLIEDMGEVIGVDSERTVIPFTDPAVAGLERSLAARAFATLPERWQAVLWHLEVEGDSPADIAPLFALTANAVSALGYRAREGLRQAYLQEHLAGDPAAPPRDRRHRETEEKLGAYTRGGLSKRDAVKVEEHLRECAECRALAAELREVNSGILRSTIAPLVLGAALVGYPADRAAPGVLTGAWPTTAEWVVAGGGVVGVVGAVGGLLGATEMPRARRLGIAAAGLAGLGVATATALGSGGAAVPEAAAPTLLPYASLPAPVLPRPPTPDVLPPTPGAPAAGRDAPGPARRAEVTRPPAFTPRAGPSTHARAPGRPTTGTPSSARRSEVVGRGAVSSGTWNHRASSSGRGSGATAAHPRPRHVDPVTRLRSTPLVDLRVLGLGADVRAARRGLLDPALDVLLR